MEDSNAERASTMPSRIVTVTHVGDACSKCAKEPAARRAVDQQVVAIASERDGHHVRLTIGVGYADVRDASGVENRIQN